MSTTMGGTVNGTRRRVLVVDDEENVAHLVSSALRFDGFETVTADSGSRALAAVAEHEPDLVVLDVMLGDLDGVEVLRRLRRASLAALRKEIEPADQRALAAFLPSWQGVDRHPPAGGGKVVISDATFNDDETVQKNGPKKKKVRMPAMT